MTPYQPYTTQFDRVVNATELPSIPLFQKLRHWIKVKKYFKLVKRLEVSVDEFLATLSSNQVDELKSSATNTTATVLVDHSGSLRAHGNAETAMCVIFTLLFLLDKLGINYEVLGFTTTSWRGGNSRKIWIENERPKQPGRLCDLLHIIYKSYDSNEKVHFELMLRNLLRSDLLKENIDGEAIEWAASRLELRDRLNKILFHVSDGAPVDDSTIQANSDVYLVDHLKSVIKSVEENRKIILHGIGMHFRVSEFFPRSINVESAGDACRILCPYIIDSLMAKSKTL